MKNFPKKHTFWGLHFLKILDSYLMVAASEKGESERN